MSFITKGLNTHRFKKNPCEKAFAKKWAEFAPNNLKYLLTPPDVDQHHPEPTSKRDELVAATVIQWLGSPVGQGFLREVFSDLEPGARIPLD